MKEFQIYRVINDNKKDRGIEVTVLTTRTLQDGQTIQRSVDRHIHPQGMHFVGRHPDFYDGVDAKNTRAEKMVSQLENQLAILVAEIERLDANPDQLQPQILKEEIRKTKDKAIGIGIDLEYAKRYLVEVREKFPRLVAYVLSAE